jgi:hypothetical protein
MREIRERKRSSYKKISMRLSVKSAIKLQLRSNEKMTENINDFKQKM